MSCCRSVFQVLDTRLATSPACHCSLSPRLESYPRTVNSPQPCLPFSWLRRTLLDTRKGCRRFIRSPGSQYTCTNMSLFHDLLHRSRRHLGPLSQSAPQHTTLGAHSQSTTTSESTAFTSPFFARAGQNHQKYLVRQPTHRNSEQDMNYHMNDAVGLQGSAYDTTRACYKSHR